MQVCWKETLNQLEGVALLPVAATLIGIVADSPCHLFTFAHSGANIPLRNCIIERDNMSGRYFQTICLMMVSIVTVSVSSHGDSPTDAARDNALKGIDACIQRNEVSSKQCKNLNKDIQTLVEVYRGGDKTVLPTLLQFTYLSDFLAEALVSDPNGFLSAVSDLPERGQQAVAIGVAGGRFWLRRPQFEAIRATLMTVSDSSPNYKFARKCLVTLETENAYLLVNYFPPGIFTKHAADFPPQSFTSVFPDFQVLWFSREMYALEEKPLWPPAPENEPTYRITVLPAFSAPESVSLEVLADGSGDINFRTTDSLHLHLSAESAGKISTQQVADFAASLDHIKFWQLPAESPQRGFDGAEWLLEGRQDGRYHIVDRWCPGKTSFGDVGRRLFDLAGHKSSVGTC